MKYYIMASKFLQLISPHSSKKIHGIYISIILTCLLILWGLAQLLFNGQYSIFTNSISNQGRTDLNPNGWFFFTAGTIFGGLGLIPHFLYLFHHLHHSGKIVLYLAVISGIYASIGFAFVGVFPGNIIKPLHSFAAQSAFNGFYISALLFLIVLIVQLFKKTNSTKWYWILLVYLLFFALLGLAWGVPKLDDNGPIPDVDPRVFSGSLWQWIGFVNVLIWLINLYLIIPRLTPIKLEENKEKMMLL